MYNFDDRMNIFGDLEDLEQVFNLDGKYDNVTRDKFYKTFCGVSYAQWQNNSPQIPTSRVQFPPLLTPGESIKKVCFILVTIIPPGQTLPS